MSSKINLLIKEKKRLRVISIKNKFSSGLFIFFVILSLSGSGVYIYWSSLVVERDSIDRSISQSQQNIASFKDVEEEKSIITVKAGELEKLIENRFDYLQAIEDVQKLFGYSLEIDNIEVSSSGKVIVQAAKQDELRVVEELAFDTNISSIELQLFVTSSEELQEAIDSLRAFHGIGLKGATIANTRRLENGGYEVDFVLNLEQRS